MEQDGAEEMKEYILRYEKLTLSEIPKVVQELVRCKDCKHHGNYECNITMLTSQVTEDDWFCADGEKKNE